MFIETVPNRASPPAVLLRESFRDDQGRAQKRTLANLSKLPGAVLEPRQQRGTDSLALSGGVDERDRARRHERPVPRDVGASGRHDRVSLGHELWITPLGQKLSASEVADAEVPLVARLQNGEHRVGVVAGAGP